MPPPRRQSGRPEHLNLTPREEDGRYTQQSPDTKRRRTMGPPSYDTTQHRQSIATPYSGPLTPYPQDFTPRNFAPYTNQPPPPHQYSQQHPHPQRSWPGPSPMTGTMPPPPRPPLSHPQTQQQPLLHHHPNEIDQSLNLPPIQLPPRQPLTPQAYIMDMPWLNKLRTCSRVSPPLKSRPNNLPRGVLIAIEGDDASSVTKVAQFLETKMKREPGNDVSLDRGPADPPSKEEGSKAEGSKVALADYINLLGEWHARCKQMVTKLLAYGENKKKRKEAEMAEELVSPRDTSRPPPLALAAASTDGARNGSSGDVAMAGTEPLLADNRKPIMLVANYLYHATNAWACAIPIEDAYTPSDHWQWMATLWRGIVGPDLTVFVKDVEKSEIECGKSVEVLEGLRTVVVKRERTGKIEWDEGVLRRVAFEVDEWIRGVEKGAR